MYQYISQQLQDPILSWKICSTSGEKYPIFTSEQKLLESVSPFYNGKRYDIPVSKYSPQERQKRRLAFRNERKLYKRACDASGRSMISIYSPDKPYKVYDAAARWSDDRNPLDYCLSFDFNKTFNEQFYELLLQVPRLGLYATNNENSDYVNGAAYNKDCYLVFASDYNKNCLYLDHSFYDESVLDSSDTKQCTQSYELISCESCTNSQYCQYCSHSFQLRYCIDCENCEYCYLSYGLRNKRYHIENISYSPDEYHTKILELNSQSPGFLKSCYEKNHAHVIHKSFFGSKNEQAYGNSISECKSSFEVYNAQQLQDCRYIINGEQSNNCQDSYVIIDNSQLCYQNISSINLYHSMATICCRNGNKYLYYCDLCQGCSHCFGCIGLRNKSYCIFNKQYSQQEYESLVGTIIEHMITTGEWGEFFDPRYSPFGYNESISGFYYPMTQEECLDLSRPWHEEVVEVKSIPSQPSEPIKNITEIDDSILQQVLICEESGKGYKIQKSELSFYRKHQIQMPRFHPEIRYSHRMNHLPGKSLCLRTCDCCDKQMISVYQQDFQGKVFCENCYEKQF